MAASRQSDDACLCVALRRASRAATRLYDEWMQESGLKITQYSLLKNIARADTVNVTDLARLVELERTALGRNLDLLERKGFIRTASDDADARSRVVALTAKGRRAIQAASPHWKEAQKRMRELLRQGKIPSLDAVFEKVASRKA